MRAGLDRKRRKALRGPNAIARQNLIKPAIVFREASSIGFGMPEVQNTGRPPAVLAAHARTNESHKQIAILASPAGKISVKTVNGDKVAAPHRKIRPTRAPPLLRIHVAQRPKWQPKQRQQPIDLAAGPLGDPMSDVPLFRRQPLAQDSLRQVTRDKHAVAGHEAAALRQRAMGGNKSRPRQAIAVKKNAIIARRSEDRTVANFGEAEAIVRVPHMRNAATEPLFPTLNDGSRVRPRAVIRHQHFEICIALLGERTQHRVERVRPVVGGDNDRDEISHGTELGRRRLADAR